MPKIVQNYQKCIGCGACAAVCPEFWELRDDGKSHLKGGKFNEEKQEYELEVDELGCNEKAKDACPVDAIEIK